LLHPVEVVHAKDEVEQEIEVAVPVQPVAQTT
jgi:hypothetical protein